MTRLSYSQFDYIDIWGQLCYEARKPNAYLLPIRIFIAVGWLRAFAEKITDPNWMSGQTLTAFLTKHLHDGMPFALYQNLAHSAFLPNADVLAPVVMIGQLLVGLALLIGLSNPFALFGALFMNLNFLLSGAPDPSAFYIVLQLVLLVGRAGEVFGLDGLLSQPESWQPPVMRQQKRTMRLLSLMCAAGSALVAILAFTGITHFDPGTSVKDAAAVLCVLGFVGLGLSIISYLRQTEYW